jgi:hypothetical protein
VGDIHGQAFELEKLLTKLSYNNIDGVWQHPTRKLIFLGDFVDRGDYQREVIDIVRPMIDNGHALSVMGNHEYNAIAFCTQNDDGDYLRPHSHKNIKQHRAFIKAYRDNPKEYKDVIEWFKTLPLWLDLEGLNVIHACWDKDLMNRIIDFQDSNLLTDELLHSSSDKSQWQYEAIETLLKGKEVPLPDGHSFLDKDKNRRHEIRIQWWMEKSSTYKDAFIGPESAYTNIPNDPINGDHLITYSHKNKPLFIGHYWMNGEIKPLATNIACLDYSVAMEGGKLVAYRWDGEQEINTGKFVLAKRSE